VEYSVASIESLTMAKLTPEVVPKSSAAVASPSCPPRILIAEDADEMRAVLALRLKQQGYQVTECCDGAELIEALGDYLGNETSKAEKQRFDLIISDIRMPGIFGSSVIEGGTEYGGFPPTILITAFGDAETHAKARQFGVAAVIDKPFDMNDLLSKVRDTLANASST
jgi:two-component system response regulator (stage 0 sporulation protein F)